MESVSYIVCKYCNQSYCNRSSLCRHVNYFCQLVPDDVKAKMVEKQQKRKKKDKPQDIPVDNSVNITNVAQTHIDKQINDNKKINITFVNICGSDVPVDVIKSMIALSDTEYDNFLKILQQVRLIQDSKVKDNTQSISQEDSHVASK